MKKWWLLEKFVKRVQQIHVKRWWINESHKKKEIVKNVWNVWKKGEKPNENIV